YIVSTYRIIQYLFATIMSFITSYLITLLFKHQNYWGMEEHASTIHAAINSLIAIIAIRTIAYFDNKEDSK
ncbi:TPA: hypothetical protein ACGF3Z_001627, partial [Vibrio cholerae]